MDRFGRRSVSIGLATLAGLSSLAVGRAFSRGADPELAIGGYDPVAYFTESRARPGDPRYEHVWDDARYRFSSAANRDRFKANPAQYAPQYPGYCAMSLADGASVEPSPENWLVRGGKLYLFGKAIGPAKFGARFDENVERADDNWRSVRRGDATTGAPQVR